MRQVYYDPFGMRLAGQQAGMRDEITMQDQTRQARASDYNFNTLQPLELHNLQRNSAYADFADPYARRGLGYAENALKRTDYEGERAAAIPYAQATGDVGPLQQIDYRRYAPDGSIPGHIQAAPPHPLVQAWDEWSGLNEQEGIDPFSLEGELRRNAVEQRYGLSEGALLDTQGLTAAINAPQQYNMTPRQNQRYNPYTGQMEIIPFNQNGYIDQAFQPLAYQNALLGVQQGNMQNRGDYNDIFRQQTENAGRRGDGSAAPAYEAHLGD